MKRCGVEGFREILRHDVAAGRYTSRSAIHMGAEFKNVDIKQKRRRATRIQCSNMNCNSCSVSTGTFPASWEQQLRGNTWVAKLVFCPTFCIVDMYHHSASSEHHMASA
jgi:hypothetical protein